MVSNDLFLKHFSIQALYQRYHFLLNFWQFNIPQFDQDLDNFFELKYRYPTRALFHQCQNIAERFSKSESQIPETP